MTDKVMTLRGMVEKTPDADVLSEMIGFGASLGDGAATAEPRPDRAGNGTRRLSRPA